jgi:transposase InsO family protein
MKALLKDSGLHQSMSSSGNCYDNSMAESFFATLKKELIYRGKFTTRNHARREILEYIEGPSGILFANGIDGLRMKS